MSNIYILYDINDDILREYDPVNVIDLIYYQKAKIINQKILDKTLSKSSNKIKKYFEQDKSKKIKKLRKLISKLDYKIPLYDEYSKNLFIINRENVYDRVVYNNYRFPDQDLINIFQDRLKKFDNKTQDILKERSKRKLVLMLEYLEQFDLEILLNTYIRVFYYYSNKVGKNITVCVRPSFLPFLKSITPFYTRSELINMALNMNLIKEDNVYYDNKKVMELCSLVSSNDIPSKTLMKHYKHIVNHNKIGIIQYYTLQGSFFMNRYLRDDKINTNKLLEEKIASVTDCINTAPAFKKSYTVYRFVRDDNYLKNLKPGDTYVEPSFISTTRNPFYTQEEYQFGFILIKIKIPAGLVGVALCIETISNFPAEQEIIFAPNSILKLDTQDKRVKYYHIDHKYQMEIKRRYEFTYVGRKKLEVIRDIRSNARAIQIIDFMNLQNSNIGSLRSNINIFIDKYLDSNYQYSTKIGGKYYTVINEFYDGTSVYSNFYAIHIDNGFFMYCFIDNYIGFTIELNENNSTKMMHVNYYFRYSSVSNKDNISDEDLVSFIASVAYYFNIKIVVIYATYKSCNFVGDPDKELIDGRYCEDFYDYLKDNKKKYNISAVKPSFDYKALDKLSSIKILEVLSPTDRDELYQIYIKIYKNTGLKDNLRDFYVWLVDNYCHHVSIFIKKLDVIYNNTVNPFENDFYSLDITKYYKDKISSDKMLLINRRSYRRVIKSRDNNEMRDKIEPKNNYRIVDNQDRYRDSSRDMKTKNNKR